MSLSFFGMMLISSKALPRVANVGSTSKARVGSVAFTFAQNLVRLGPIAPLQVSGR